MVKGTDVAYRIDASNVVLSAVRKEVSAQPRFVPARFSTHRKPVVGQPSSTRGRPSA
ncbi:MAG: hypothetical protein ACLRM8_02135 [Alistipes sp.]